MPPPSYRLAPDAAADVARATVRLRRWGFATAALVGLVALSALAPLTLAGSARAKDAVERARLGRWVVMPFTGSGLDMSCTASNFSIDRRDAILTAYVSSLGAIGFALYREPLVWQNGDALPEVLVDGVTIPLGTARVIAVDTVNLEAKAAGRQPGGILRALEAGERAVVQLSGIRATFDLAETKAAMALLSRCAMNGGRIPADALAAERSRRAGVEPQPQPGIDLERRDVEEEEEEASTPSGGASGGLGGVLDTLDAQGTPVVRYQCLFSGMDLLGMPDFTRDRPSEAALSIGADGVALVNGTAVRPAEKRPVTGTVRSALYPARDVVQAIMGAPSERSPLANQSPEKDASWRYAQSLMRDQVDLLMADRRRFMMVGIAQDLVSFFDLGEGGNPVGQSTARCERLP